VVGFTSFGIEYTLFVLFRKWLPLPELAVNIGVYSIVFWLNFLLNRKFAFRSKSAYWKQILLYGLLFAFNLVVGNVLLFSAIRRLLALWSGEGSWPVLYLPKILIMFFIVSWNFILYKKVIYK
jgi:putative flippase GtrA